MTVAEVIAALSVLPGELPVYIGGQEGGVDDVTTVHVGHYQRNAHPASEHWMGRHQHRPGLSGQSLNGVEFLSGR